MRLLYAAMMFRQLLLEKEMDKRRCQKCGKITIDYTYVLSVDEYDGGQKKVSLVCIPCKKDIDMFFKRKKK